MVKTPNTDTTKILTVVMPVYNVEQYLEQAIRSIIEQDIGFKEHILLYLVNDGSTDSSGEICERYADKYPENIVCFTKVNGGLSSARNLGYSHVKTKYVTFCDSDDYWGTDALSKMISFFDQHFDEIDAVASRFQVFGDAEYEHPLNFRCTGDRIIDLNKEPYAVQTYVINLVYKTESLRGFPFDESVVLFEDVLFNTKFFMRNKAYGMVSDAVYYYRRQFKTRTLSNFVRYDRNWYLGVPRTIFQPLIEYSRREYGKVDTYLQSVIAFFLKWRIAPTGIAETLTAEERTEYESMLRQILQVIDDNVLAAVHGMTVTDRNFWYRLKYGVDFFEQAECREGVFLFHGHNIFSAKGRGIARITDVRPRFGKTVVSGTSILGIAEGHCSLHAETMEGEELQLKVSDEPDQDIYAFNGDLIRRGKTFRLVLPRKYQSPFRLYTQTDRSEEKYYFTPVFGSEELATFDPLSKAITIIT